MRLLPHKVEELNHTQKVEVRRALAKNTERKTAPCWQQTLLGLHADLDPE